MKGIRRCLSAQTLCLWLWSELCCRYSSALSGTLLVLTLSCWLHFLACPADLPLVIPVAITALLCFPCLAHWDCALVEDPRPGIVWIQALCPCKSFCWVLSWSLTERKMQNMSFVSCLCGHGTTGRTSWNLLSCTSWGLLGKGSSCSVTWVWRVERRCRNSEHLPQCNCSNLVWVELTLETPWVCVCPV